VLKLTDREQRQLDALTRGGLPVLAWREHRELQTATLRVSRVPYLIGRAASANVRLSDDTVSASHALLEIASPEDVYVTDNGSTNGTYVNGTRIRRRVRLRDGAVLRLGSEWLLVRLAKDGAGTVAVEQGGTLEDLPPRRFEVLWWLCEPITQRDRPEPASRADLCIGLNMSASTLGEHLRGAADVLGASPGEGMRLRLARRAVQLGIGAWERPTGSTR